MPELPEVETVVRDLRKKLVGLKVINVELNTPKMIQMGHFSSGVRKNTSPEMAKEFVRTLQGKTFDKIERRAKLLQFFLSESWVLLVHLKMTGQFIFEDSAQKKKTGGRYRILNKISAPLVELPYKHTHVVFHFQGGRKLFFNDVRKFGYLKLLRAQDLYLVNELNNYGPEPLSAKFTSLYFMEKARKRKYSVKQYLMDNKIMVGIGNIYSDEILFHAKVLPTRSVNSLSELELKAVFSNIGPVLEQGIKSKGSSVGDFIRPDGSWGGMGKFHFVYGRKGKECKVCGKAIKSAKLGGRTTSFCPNCQL